MKFKQIDIFVNIYNKTDFVIRNYEMDLRNSTNIPIYSLKFMTSFILQNQL